MDLEENIRIAAEMQAKADTSDNFQGADHKYKMGYYQGVISGFKDGAKSQAAKDYWYNEFKREQIGRNDINAYARAKGLPALDAYDLELKNHNPNMSLEEANEIWQKQVIEPTYRYDEFVQYRKDNPEKEISYKEWADKYIYSDGILEQMKNVPAFDMKENEPIDKNWIYSVIELQQQQEQYEQYIKEHSDRPISFDNWKYMVEHYDTILDKTSAKSTLGGVPFAIILDEDWHKPFNEEYINESLKNLKPNIANGKRPIGIIGHDKISLGHEIANRISNKKHVIIIGVGPGKHCRQESNVIESIAPITDIIPELIISKYEFLKMHDKAVERSITDEAFKESRAWDIKKEKKVSHKRTNKRK